MSKYYVLSLVVFIYCIFLQQQQKSVLINLPYTYLFVDLEMVDSVEVKELASRSKKLKEALLEEVRSFYSAWSDRLSLMTKRHKEEQKKLIARGMDIKFLSTVVSKNITL